MHKTRIFLSGLLPLILCLCIQYGAVILLSIGAQMIAIFQLFLKGDAGSALYYINFLLDSPDAQTLLMIMYTIIGIAVFSLWYCLRCEGSLKLHSYPVSYGYRILGLLILIPGLQFFSGFLCSVIQILIPGAMEEYEELLEMAGFSGSPSLILILYSVLFAPICEELIFRGVTLKIYKRIFRRFWIANLLQAILFGIFHGNLVQGIYTFAIGFAFGLICEYGGSIWDSILIHILFNLWGTLISDYLDVLPDAFWVDLLLLGIIPVSICAGLFLFYKSDRFMLRRRHAA